MPLALKKNLQILKDRCFKKRHIIQDKILGPVPTTQGANLGREAVSKQQNSLTRLPVGHKSESRRAACVEAFAPIPDYPASSVRFSLLTPSSQSQASHLGKQPSSVLNSSSLQINFSPFQPPVPPRGISEDNSLSLVTFLISPPSCVICHLVAWGIFFFFNAIAKSSGFFSNFLPPHSLPLPPPPFLPRQGILVTFLLQWESTTAKAA